MPRGYFTRQPRPIQPKFEKHISMEPMSGCWLWTGDVADRSRPGSNYGSFSINYKRCRAHRVSWELYHGPIPEGMGVLHKCDTPTCVNPRHLFLGTQKDNAADAGKKGRLAIGEDNGKTKLTDEQVRQIREDARSPFIVADTFGINVMYVRQLKHRLGRRRVQ